MIPTIVLQIEKRGNGRVIWSFSCGLNKICLFFGKFNFFSNFYIKFNIIRNKKQANCLRFRWAYIFEYPSRYSHSFQLKLETIDEYHEKCPTFEGNTLLECLPLFKNWILLNELFVKTNPSMLFLDNLAPDVQKI